MELTSVCGEDFLSMPGEVGEVGAESGFGREGERAVVEIR